jgi:hypothetical protein
MAKQGKNITPEDIRAKELGRVATYHRLFNTEDGKRVLEDLKNRYYDEELFVRDDPMGTSYNVGMRDVVKFLMLSKNDGANIDMGEEMEA